MKILSSVFIFGFSMLGLGCSHVERTVPKDAGDNKALGVSGSFGGYFESFETRFGFNGVALVSRGDELLWRKAYGWADASKSKPLTVEHRFHIGSLTKQFTAAAVLSLVDRGQIELDEKIGTYLTKLPEPARNLTIHQLLSHTSGIATMPNAEGGREFVPGPISKEEYLSHFVDDPLRFEPGTRYEYSNSGMYLLGVLVESVSDKPISKFVVPM